MSVVPPIPKRPRLSLTRDPLTAIASIAAAIAAGLSAYAAFRLETVTVDAASRQEKATFSSNLYGRQLDLTSGFYSEYANFYAIAHSFSRQNFTPDEARQKLEGISSAIDRIVRITIEMSVVLPNRVAYEFQILNESHFEQIEKILERIVSLRLHDQDYRDTVAKSERALRSLSQITKRMNQCIRTPLSSGQLVDEIKFYECTNSK